MSEESQKFEHWALVELMGHQRIAGRVVETQIAGKGFLQVDVPDAEGEKTLFTRLYSPDAVYCINPLDKKLAVALANQMQTQPVQPYQFSNLLEDKAAEEPEAEPISEAADERGLF